MTDKLYGLGDGWSNLQTAAFLVATVGPFAIFVYIYVTQVLV